MKTLGVSPFILAWHFLTAVPLSRVHHEPGPGDLARSMRWYPIVGLILGGLLVLMDSALAELFTPAVRDVLLVAVLVLLTRGLHQDGLADSVDGMVGGHSPEERLAIMRDPRIGAFGATALFLALGMRYAAIGALPHTERAALLLCMPVLGRWAMVVGATAAPYARKEGGVAQPFLSHLSGADLLWASIPTTLCMLWLLGPVPGLAAVILGGLTAYGFAALSTRLCGGITGDTLGGTNELVEILYLLAMPGILSLV